MKRLLGQAALAVAIGFCHPALAEDISVKCAGMRAYAPDAALCLGEAALHFTAEDPASPYALRIRLPPGACADVSFTVRRARPGQRGLGAEGVAYSYRLRGGQAQTLPIGAGFLLGDNELRISGILYRGQCAGRAAGNWQAEVRIEQAALSS